MTTALIVVDVQVDFCEGGRLAVDGGNEVAENIAQFLKRNVDEYDLICFTRDFHDQYGDNDGHFSETPDFDKSWPVHCTIGSEGVKLHPALRPHRQTGRLFSKGYQANDYSGFQGRGCNMYLHDWLQRNNVDTLDIVGIAGDYCVRATALDAVRKGYLVMPLSEGLIASVGGPEATRRVRDEINRAQGRY